MWKERKPFILINVDTKYFKYFITNYALNRIYHIDHITLAVKNIYI